MTKELLGWRIPCVSTWYNHINANDIGIPYGSTPYHPSKRNRSGPKPHTAKTGTGRLQINDHPAESKNRSLFGHYEIDTVVSSTNSTGKSKKSNPPPPLGCAQQGIKNRRASRQVPQFHRGAGGS